MKIGTVKNIKCFSKNFDIPISKAKEILIKLNSGGFQNSPMNLQKQYKLTNKACFALTHLIC